MATIHILEIQKILANQSQKDALPYPGEGKGYFIEIRFDDPTKSANVVDEAFKNKVITADCPYGTVTIQFDKFGQLRSIDLS